MEITISGKLVNYDAMGSGAPILFVHGWGGSKDSLRKIAESFLSTNQCYLIDLPGFGESENPPLDWGLEGYTDLVRKFILELNITPIVYVGHSFGGAIGLSLAAQNSEMFDKLIVISPSYRRPLARVLKNFNLSGFKRKLRPIRRLFYKIFYPGSVALKFSHLEDNFRRIISTDLTNSVGSINIPTLILWPADDIETPLNDAYLLNDEIENSKLKVFGSYSHDLPIKNPDLVADNIKDFLK